eukprot:3937550-Rhodomonas_salina.1
MHGYAPTTYPYAHAGTERGHAPTAQGRRMHLNFAWQGRLRLRLPTGAGGRCRPFSTRCCRLWMCCCRLWRGRDAIYRGRVAIYRGHTVIEARLPFIEARLPFTEAVPFDLWRRCCHKWRRC